MIVDAYPHLDTPALCIDREALEYNISAIARWCSQYGKQWRPHAKCHRSGPIAQRLVAAGAIGATCATLAEAEVLAAAGISDLLIANLVVAARKLERLVQLRRVANPMLCVDHIAQAEALNATFERHGMSIRVLVEVDIGMKRVGVSPGEAAWQLARNILRLPHLELAGLMGYEGHLLLVEDPQEKRRRIHQALDLLQETRDLWRRHGVACPIVSCGGTGSLPYCLEHPAVTEVQAGGAIFMDEFYRHHCHTLPLRQSLWVLSRVVSRPCPLRAVMDAGRKALSQDLAWPRVVSPTGCRVMSLSAEHGVLAVAEDAEDISLGSLVRVIPGYSDFTTVLHDRYVVLSGDETVDEWPIRSQVTLHRR